MVRIRSLRLHRGIPALVAVLTLLASLLPSGVEAQSGTLCAGATAMVTNTGDVGLRLRAYASDSAEIRGRNYDGARVQILDGPVDAEGYTWWRIQSPAGTGWSAGGTHWFAPMPQPGVCMYVTVANTGDIGLRLRSYASQSAPVLGRNYDGTQVLIDDGPVAADGYTWWKIRSPAGTGWSAGLAEWLIPVAPPAPADPPPTVVSTNPTANETSAAATDTITATFSEDIRRGTGSVYVVDAAGGTAPPRGVAASGRTLTITLASLLAYSTGYGVLIQQGAVTDVAGNPNADYSWVFVTRAAPQAPPPPPAGSPGPPPPPVAISTPSPLPEGTQNHGYNLSFQASGGSGGYTWSLVLGTLPAGLSVSGAGLLSGTPTNYGDFSFSVQATAGNGAYQGKAFALHIAPAIAAPPPASPPPAAPPPPSSPPPSSPPPGLVLAGQFKSDGTTRLDGKEPVTEKPAAVVKGRVEYAGAGKVRLEVELKRQDEPDSSFTGAATHRSAWAAPATEISLSVSGLSGGTYHWQARAVTDQGVAGPWVTFGDNSESEADFYVLKSPDTSYGRVNALLEEAARDYDLPPMLFKAIAFRESNWLQVKGGGLYLHPEPDGRFGVGVMQVTVRPEDDYGDYHRLGWDLEFNIREGARILREKWLESQRQNPPGVEDDPYLIENWWYATVWYRGHREDSVAYAAEVRGYLAAPPSYLRGSCMSPMEWTLPTQVIPGFRLGDGFSARDLGAGQGEFFTYDAARHITGYYPAAVHRWKADGDSATGTAEPGSGDAAVSPEREAGDVTGDGAVNVLDAMRTLNIALGKAVPSEEELAAADGDGDGVVSVLDVVRIINLALGRR